jgi:hypothetical protein
MSSKLLPVMFYDIYRRLLNRLGVLCQCILDLWVILDLVPDRSRDLHEPMDVSGGMLLGTAIDSLIGPSVGDTTQSGNRPKLLRINHQLLSIRILEY